MRSAVAGAVRRCFCQSLACFVVIRWARGTRCARVHQATSPYPQRTLEVHTGSHGVPSTQTLQPPLCRLRLPVPVSLGRRVMPSGCVPARRRMLSRGEPQRQLPCRGGADVAPADRGLGRRSRDAAAQACRSGNTARDGAGRQHPNVPTRDQPTAATVLPLYTYLFGVCGTGTTDPRCSTGKLAHHQTARSLPTQQTHRRRSSATAQALAIAPP
jgi:hypothetical protein